MASKKSKKYKRYPKKYSEKGLQGKKENAFYFDHKSNHPFVSQSAKGIFIYGHNVTHSPSLNPDGSIKKKYRRLSRSKKSGDRRPSFFDTHLERIDNTPRNGKKTGRLKRKDWPVSASNRKALKKAEKERVRRIKRKRAR